jgi:hypothetical protein
MGDLLLGRGGNSHSAVLKDLLHGCRHSLHRKLGSTAGALASRDAVRTLTAEEGAGSARPKERQAAQLGLGSAMAENASGVAPHLMPRLESMLDLKEHTSLSPTQIKVFQTPRGVLPPSPASVVKSFGPNAATSGICTVNTEYLVCTMQAR